MGAIDWIKEKRRKMEEEKSEYDAAYKEEFIRQSTERRAAEHVAKIEKARENARADANHGGQVGRRASELFTGGLKVGAGLARATSGFMAQNKGKARAPARRGGFSLGGSGSFGLGVGGSGKYSLGAGSRGGLSLALGGKKKKGMPFI